MTKITTGDTVEVEGVCYDARMVIYAAEAHLADTIEIDADGEPMSEEDPRFEELACVFLTKANKKFNTAICL